MWCIVVLQKNTGVSKSERPWLFYQCQGIAYSESNAETIAAQAAVSFKTQKPNNAYLVAIGKITDMVQLTMPPIERIPIDKA